MPEALGPSARKTDAEVLNTIYDLARDAGEKHAAHSRHNDAREKALEKVKRGKQNSGQAGRALAQAESKVGLAQRALNKAESAKTNGTATGQNPVEKAQEGLKTAKDEFARLKAKFDVAIGELENDEVRLGALELSLAAAKTETLTANEALKEAIGSQQFDFDAMSATDLARLSLVLVDHPDAKKDAAKQLTASAQRIEDAVLERFTHPSPETIASVAQASRDRSASRALANAISFMKPRPWAELFMAVQGQANRLVDPADPFIEELMGKIGGMERASMKFLDERIENMAPHWRDAYVSRLDAEIFKSVVAVASDQSNPEAFLRCSERLMAHAGAWSARQLARPADERTPYLANLTTTELAGMFEAFRKDPRWLSSDRGTTLVAQFSSRFHECLMATDSTTAKEDLGALVRAAMSTSYVASLTPPQIGRLFALLQNNAAMWRGEDKMAVTAQVNSRFLHQYLPSINSRTSQEELAWLSTVFRDLGNQWQAGVAGQVARTNCEPSVAEANTPFGTLGTDEVAQLFVASQRVTPLLPNAEGIADNIGRKLAACYAQVDLKTHQMLVKSFQHMSPAGQALFTELANRPPAELKPLLDQVFRKMGALFEPHRPNQPHDFFRVFQEDILHYRMTLPGSSRTPEAMHRWLLAALPVTKSTVNVTTFATSVGPFRDAWLKPGAPGDLHQYVDAAVRAAQAIDPGEWRNFEALGSVSRFFSNPDISWTPALQKHFESLIKHSSDKPQKAICMFHLEVLRTYQEVSDKKAKGISGREAGKMIKKLEKMAPNRTAGQFLNDTKLQLVRESKDNNTRDYILSDWKWATNAARDALLKEGSQLYLKSVAPAST